MIFFEQIQFVPLVMEVVMRLRRTVVSLVLLAAAGVVATLGLDQAQEISHLAGFTWSN
ncbi:hypothetical protein [Micromonospora sp. NPDC049900]|uniref:hypothetical protein n=1 Tax=unclassified Micromonospora TaxID=2617518 RepID=UPI0037BB3549